MSNSMSNDYAVYAFGSNGSGQLGIGHREDVSEPSLVLFENECVRQFRPLKIAAGGNHTLLRDSEGCVYACGQNDNGCCGIYDEVEIEKHYTRFRRISFLPTTISSSKQAVDHFLHIAATWEASYFVAGDGKVYTCGSGNKGELGHGINVDKSIHPRAIPDFPPSEIQIVDIAAGVSHVVAVLSDGSVYGWGSGRKAEIGTPAQSSVSSPRRIEGINFSVVRAVCGLSFTALFADSQSGECKILGNDKFGVVTSAPPANSIRGWKDVGATWGGIYVHIYDGQIVSWGRNDKAQLAPVELPLTQDLVSGSEHVLARSRDGQIIAWGWGEHGNCGSEGVEEGGASSGWNIIKTRGQWSVLGAGCATSWLIKTDEETSDSHNHYQIRHG